jgi:hypothetical protein
MAQTFWFEPAKRGPVAGVSATPNAQPIAFQQVVPEYFETFIGLFRVKKLLALLLALGVCEVVTPSPNMVWKWRRGPESARFPRRCTSNIPDFIGYSSIKGFIRTYLF